MFPSLRGVVGFAAAATALVGCGSDSTPPQSPVPGSTLVRTLEDPDGDGVLSVGPGSPLRPRTDLASAAGVARTLVSIAQISDIHVVDEESPLRAEIIDRFGGSLTSSFRPQEGMSTQVLAATVQSINAFAPDAVLVSGDILDNAQSNELTWAITGLRGGSISPDSGKPGYNGVQAADWADPFFYRPDIDAPRDLGLLARAQQPFLSPGLRAPWFPAVSNHDVSVQGLVPPTPTLDAQAASGRKLARASDDVVELARRAELDPARIETFLGNGTLGEFREVPADPARRLLGSGEAVSRIAAAAGVSRRGDLLSYDRLIARGVRLVVLDTADRRGGGVGILEQSQLTWLARTLSAHRSDRVLVLSPTPLEDTRGGQRAFTILDAAPNVIAVLSGDTHRSRIEPRSTATGGYWLVRTPSLADYPQQARAYRLVELTDGRLALQTWLIDHAGRSDESGPMGLAGRSRELAYLDTQGGRPKGWSGGPDDRNATLYLTTRREVPG